MIVYGEDILIWTWFLDGTRKKVGVESFGLE
jgi:hypothetical protein